MSKYECDQCGACCQGHLLVEAYQIDVLREPRLLTADPHYAGKSVDEAIVELEDEFKCVLLTPGRPCGFLDDDNRCSIYPTRPNTCVGFAAGDEQCQEARRQAGLPPLEPTSST